MSRICFAFCLLVAFVFASSLSAQNATVVQLPTFGVAVDADGVLTVKEVRDPGGRLLAARIAAARGKLPADVAAPSKLRFVSLNRLEAATEKRIDAGKPVDDVMQNLAGLQRVQFVMCLPDRRDVILAGPAEGWVDNGGDWGTIRYYQGTLIIRAPDFMHRQIGGYPFAVRPRRGAAAVTAKDRRYVTFTGGISEVKVIGLDSTRITGTAGGGTP